MSDTSVEVMTVEEVAIYLRIPVSSVYKLAKEGKIPSQKVGRHWRFRRAALEEWLSNNPGEPPPVDKSNSDSEQEFRAPTDIEA